MCSYSTDPNSFDPNSNTNPHLYGIPLAPMNAILWLPPSWWQTTPFFLTPFREACKPSGERSSWVLPTTLWPLCTFVFLPKKLFRSCFHKPSPSPHFPELQWWTHCISQLWKEPPILPDHSSSSCWEPGCQSKRPVNSSQGLSRMSYHLTCGNPQPHLLLWAASYFWIPSQ